MDLHEIFTEGWQWANEQVIKFSGDNQAHRLDTGIIFFRIRRYWEIREVVNGHSFILISSDLPDMAALVRGALAEVCTVPVLQVHSIIRSWACCV